MDLFKNRNFVRLFFAAFASQMGTTVGNMAFAFFLLDRFSSQPAYTTIAELMYSLPTVFVFFIVGVVADRFDRKKVAENCDWIRAGLTVVLFFVLYLQIIPLVFLVLFIRSAVTKFFYPAEASLVQAILRKDQYAKAAGLNQMLFSLFLLFGVGIGAFMYKTIGLHGAIALDFVSFIVSGFLIRSCDIPLAARKPNGNKGWKNMTVKDSMRDFKEGIVYILKNKLLASLVFGYFIFGLVSGGLSVLPMFKMKYELSPDSYEWHTSLFTIVLGIGLLTGIAVAALLKKSEAGIHDVSPDFYRGCLYHPAWLYRSIARILLGCISCRDMHRADQHSSWRLDSQNRPSKADGKGQRVDRSADNAGAILSAWHDRCPIPGNHRRCGLYILRLGGNYSAGGAVLLYRPA